MKKVLTMFLALVLVFSLVACTSSKPAPATEAKKTEVEATKAPEAATTAELKTGLGFAFNNAQSKDPTEGKNGVVDTQVYVMAVLLDAEGKIVKCALDSVQSRFEFSPEGEILTAPDTQFKSKNELGAEYGMKKASKIGKEWNEQALAFANYCLGKSAEEIKNIAVDKGVATDTDLASTVTVHIAPFQTAALNAIANAKNLGAKTGDTLGLGVFASANKTRQKADGDKKAEAVAYNFYTACTFSAEQKITSAVIDSTQAKFALEAGKIATALDAEIKSKNELGAAYGMKKASKIGKEWDEQAAAFAQYALGKTAAELAATPLKEGVPTEADLSSTVTVHVDPFIAALDMASKNAQ